MVPGRMANAWRSLKTMFNAWPHILNCHLFRRTNFISRLLESSRSGVSHSRYLHDLHFSDCNSTSDLMLGLFESFCVRDTLGVLQELPSRTPCLKLSDFARKLNTLRRRMLSFGIISLFPSLSSGVEIRCIGSSSLLSSNGLCIVAVILKPPLDCKTKKSKCALLRYSCIRCHCYHCNSFRSPARI